MTGKTVIFGNGPCAHYIAKDLLYRGAEVIIATRDKRCGFPWSVDSGSIEILAETKLLSCRGSAGNYRLVASQNDKKITRTVSSVIIAEEDQRTPNFSLYGLKPLPNVISLSSLMERLSNSSPEENIFLQAKKMVFLTGLFKESYPVIAQQIMRASLLLQSDFHLQTYILTNNLKVAANGLEALYRQTKKAGAIYVKFADTLPKIHQGKDGLVQIEFFDEVTLKQFRLTPDITVVDETIIPSDYTADLSRIFKVDTDNDGFAQADNIHRLCVFTNRKGILTAGPSRCIQGRSDQITDAENAAIASSAFTCRRPSISEDRAEIDTGKCVRCLTCYRLCPYRAITLNTKVSVVPDACERCGICAAQCPMAAIHIKGLEPVEISDRIIKGRIRQTQEPFIPLLVAFCCTRSAVQARELASRMGHKLPARLTVIEVPCAGCISFEYIFAAFENNADGVLVLTCHEGNCHSEYGNIYTQQTVDQIKQFFIQSGFETERIVVQTIASNMGVEFGKIVNHFEEKILKLGPSRLKRQ